MTFRQNIACAYLVLMLDKEVTKKVLVKLKSIIYIYTESIETELEKIILRDNWVK